MLSILTSVIGFVSIPKPRLEADYIIVGAGGAGCPLAARMAVAGLDVLLLEEGPNDDGTHFSLLFQANIDPYDASRGPAVLQNLLQLTAPDITRNVFSEPVWEPGFERVTNASGPLVEVHNFALQAIGQLPDDFALMSLEHHAKIVGGNTMHNSMYYWRPGNASIRNFGSNLWSPETMTQVFDEMEREHLKLPEGRTFNNTLHAQHLGIDKRPDQAFLDAAMAVEGAYAVPRGRLAGAQNKPWAVASIERTYDSNDRRISAASAFLIDEVRALPNLEVRPMSKVLRVVVEDKEGDKVATGIVYRDVNTGVEYEVKARKEVILSLGAVFTPWMLMLSGIGPEEELNEKNIPVHVPLPGVGKNFQNHLLVALNVGGPAEVLKDKCSPSPDLCLMDTTVHTFSSQSSPEEGDDSDITMYTLVAAYDPVYDRSVFGLEVMVGGKVKSKGSVHLASSSADDYPSIRPGYYQGEGVADLDVLTEGYKIFKEQWLSRMGPEYYIIDPAEDVPFADHAKAKAGSHWHYAGTCKMADESDPLGVVDERLHVRGVRGLRVADMSVMPVEPNMHTQALAMAIGYRAASLFVEDA